MNWGEVIITIIGALGLERLIIYLLERKSRSRQAEAAADTAEAGAAMASAEAESKSLDNAFRMIDLLRQQVEAQSKRIADLELRITRLDSNLRRSASRIEYLMRGIRVLLGQLEEACIEPQWKPDEWELDNHSDG